jgi:hypothetical protein
MNCDELLKFFDSTFYGPISTASVFGQEPWHTYSNQLMYVGWRIFGLNHWGIRAHSIVIGCLLIVLTFVYTTYWFDRAAGLIAAGFVSGSAVLITYSVYGRNYIHIPFLGMAALLLVHRGLWHGRNAYVYLAAICVVLGLYGLPTMSVFFLAGFVMLGFHCVRAMRTGAGAPWRVYAAYPLVSLLVTALLYVPFLIVSGYDEFIGRMFEQQDAAHRTAAELASAGWKMLVLYHQLLPEWLPSWLMPGVIAVGAVLSMTRSRGRFVLIGVLGLALLSAWGGMGFRAIRLYSYLIPFMGIAAAVAAVEAWSAPWRVRGLLPRGLTTYAAVVSLVVLAVGLKYGADPENLFGTRTEERVFGRREDRLIVPNAQGVDAMIEYLHTNGLLREGVLVESPDFTFNYPVRFALLEHGYPDEAHFSLWGNFPNPKVIYEVYPASAEPPEFLEYQGARLRRGRVLMSFDRSKLVEFL